jgi:hypothetical protein
MNGHKSWSETEFTRIMPARFPRRITPLALPPGGLLKLFGRSPQVMRRAVAANGIIHISIDKTELYCVYEVYCALERTRGTRTSREAAKC